MIIPKKISLNKIKEFFKKKKLFDLIKSSSQKEKNILNLKSNSPYKPDLRDLYNLYQFIILNKRTTILEFGCGWSSLVFSLALSELKRKYKTDKIRRQNPFELFILDNENKFLKITKKRIQANKAKLKLISKVNYTFASIKMVNHLGNISTEYTTLPQCNPDFIYLDGPDQFNVKGKVNNISTAHKDFMPMSCDILKIENFLIPGTIIVTDGRKANARYLQRNLKRKWRYYENKLSDQVIFYLDEKPLGIINKKLLNFYKKI